MEKQSNVMKSKSSNTTMYTKNDKNNKKSRSNADFQPYVLKKRVNRPPKPKAPPRPRPGSKRFLTSVLTILSKSSTTATQHPEADNAKTSKTRNNNPDATVEKRAKRKFKSRILNNQDDKLIVLQSTKDIINTPSVYSERSQDTMKTTLSRLPRSDLLQTIDKAIGIDVKKGRKDKKVTIDEPVTLVQNKKDPALYNFFVDLLHTTFSASNINTPTVDMKKPSISKIDLAINESVAKKLNVINETEPPLENEKAAILCCLADENWSDVALRDPTPAPIKYSKIDVLPKQWHRKHKRPDQSTRVMLPKAYSGLLPSKKSYTTKNKKKIILKLLKKELQVDMDPFLEPQNLYQALQNIARNKRKYQKSIRVTKIENNDECIFKQKKVISPSNTRKRFDKDPKFKSVDYSNSYVKRQEKEYPSEESLHSLEVFDYDYEVDEKSRKEKIFYARPSFISIDLSRVNEDLIQLPDDFNG